MNRERWGLVLALLLPVVVLVAGCAPKSEPPAPTAKGQGSGPAAHTTDDGWWCNEHGIPEEECSMCQAKVEKECRDKGDWCDKHNRAKSQCFICNPELKEQYAARYRARYGKEPPPPEE